MTSRLFQPIRLGGLDLFNRIVIAPMCQYSADNGSATDWHMQHLGNLALSGAGLLIVEATGVEPGAGITYGDLALHTDGHEAALGRVVAAIRRYSPIRLGIQLAHAGRKASCELPWRGGLPIPPGQPGGWQVDAPSALPFLDDAPIPTALDAGGLARIREAFAGAARRAVRLGFDLIELHAAHGYLLHQFLSPLSNQRNDAYGGPLADRMRFPLEVFDAVRAVVPGSVPVGVRVSATDWAANGWDIEQTVVFAQALQARGCDFMDVSSGGLTTAQSIPLAPGYQVPFAARVRRETGMPTMAVGLITETQQAEAILAAGDADMIALARGILYDPRWPWHAAAELGERAWAPPQYLRSQPRTLKTLFDVPTQ